MVGFIKTDRTIQHTKKLYNMLIKENNQDVAAKVCSMWQRNLTIINESHTHKDYRE